MKKLRWLWTAIRVLPRTILHNGWRDFCLMWDTEIQLEMMGQGERL